MIIDIHTHAFPDDLAPRAVTTLSERSQVPSYTDGTVASLHASTRSAGIDISAIMPIATKPGQVRGINRWAAEVNQQFDNIICFGTLHPLQDDWQDEINTMLADGIPGVKMHPDYQEYFVDETSVTPIYQAMADAGLILLLHAGLDIGLPLPIHCTPPRLARVLDEVPNLTVIAAHMGGYTCWDEVEQYLVGRNVYLDTSFSLADLGPERFTAIIRAHGADKILFGTDSPWTSQTAELESIRTLSLTAEEISAILGANAARLLHVI